MTSLAIAFGTESCAPRQRPRRQSLSCMGRKVRTQTTARAPTCGLPFRGTASGDRSPIRGGQVQVHRAARGVQGALHEVLAQVFRQPQEGRQGPSGRRDVPPWKMRRRQAAPCSAAAAEPRAFATVAQWLAPAGLHGWCSSRRLVCLINPFVCLLGAVSLRCPHTPLPNSART